MISNFERLIRKSKNKRILKVTALYRMWNPEICQDAPSCGDLVLSTGLQSCQWKKNMKKVEILSNWLTLVCTLIPQRKVRRSCLKWQIWPLKPLQNKKGQKNLGYPRKKQSFSLYRVSRQLVLTFDFNSWLFWLSYQKM